MVVFIFLKFGMVKFYKPLQTVSKVKKITIFQIKIFNDITPLLLIIYSFVNFKVLVSLPESFRDTLGY